MDPATLGLSAFAKATADERFKMPFIRHSPRSEGDGGQAKSYLHQPTFDRSYDQGQRLVSVFPKTSGQTWRAGYSPVAVACPLRLVRCGTSPIIDGHAEWGGGQRDPSVTMCSR